MNKNSPKMPSRALTSARIVLAALSFSAGLLAFGFCLSPYSFLKSLGDHLSADGNFKSFTLGIYSSLRLPAALAGLLLVLIGLGLLLFAARSERVLGAWGSFLRNTLKDARALFHDLFSIRLDWKEGLSLLAIFLTGLAARVMLLNRPIEYDEAYTFTQYARYPFRVIVSDYSAPNNHVFHTILMRLAYLVLGDQPWQIRLPAFLIGLLILLAAYLLGRSLYGRVTGLMAAGLLACLPDFIIRSVSARGYTTVVLMALLDFILAAYLIRHKNRFGWGLLALFGAIGFYSVPIMLYPISAVFLWLLLSIVDVDPQQYSRASWMRWLVGAGLLMVGLTALFYSPILLSPNAASFYRQNNTLHPLPLSTFISQVPGKFSQVITEWQRFLPVVWSVVILIGLLLSLVWIRRNNKFKIPTQLVFILALGGVLLVQRPGSVTRIWLWIVPLLAIWSSAGLVTTLQALRAGPARAILTAGVPLVIVGGMAINALGFAHTAQMGQWGEDPLAAEVTQAALPYVTSESYIAVNGCYDARYWYYFYIHGVPAGVFYKRTEPRPFDRVFAIVYNQPAAGCGTEPVDDTLQEFGPDISLLDMNTLKPVATVDFVTVYEVLPAH